MIPDPVSLDLARQVPYRYQVVHDWLNAAANAGFSLDEASEWLFRFAERGYYGPTYSLFLYVRPTPIADPRESGARRFP